MADAAYTVETIDLNTALAICSACNVCDDSFYYEDMIARLTELWPHLDWFADPDEQFISVRERTS